MSAAIEIHGVSMCPFAFRTRLTAREKGVSFVWVPFDVPAPDPRATSHNPNKRSPLMWHDGFVLVDSAVLMPYIDEAFDGPPLQPADPKLRARMRSAQIELASLKFDGRKELTAETRTAVEGGLRVLEDRLGEDPWLGGATPSLADLELWPWLPLLDLRGVLGPATAATQPHVAAYWDRVRARESFRENNPYGARPPG